MRVVLMGEMRVVLKVENLVDLLVASKAGQ
jgi:hypothetical protein